MYLLYPTEQDAWDRSEEEGIAQGLAYHTKGQGSRWITSPEPTADGKWALDVSEYALSDSESNNVVNTFMTLEEEFE